MMTKYNARARTLVSFLLASSLPMIFCGPKPLTYQALLIGSVGDVPFSDAIWTTKLDGSRLGRVFTPRAGESFLAAWGECTSGPLIVVVHKASEAGTKDVLWIADDRFHLLRPLADRAKNRGQAYPSLSPDEHSVAYVAAPRLGASPAIWIHDIGTDTDEKISWPYGSGFWDTSPEWTDNGGSVLFIRGHRIRSGIETELMVVDIDSKQNRTILGTAMSPVAFAISPDGSRMIAIERDGIQIYTIDGRPLEHVADWKALPAGVYQGSEVVWLPSPDRAVFAMRDRSAKRSMSQLFSIRLDTGHTAKLCRVPGRVTSIAWLKLPK